VERSEAIQAAKNGAIAAALSGIVTLGLVIFALYSNSEDDFRIWNDPSNFFDVWLVFLCAFGMYRKSRAAAVVIFVYFIISKIYVGLSLGRIPNLAIGLVFLYFYGKAIQGTFVFHRLERAVISNIAAVRVIWQREMRK
jgi:hypothetical protein